MLNIRFRYHVGHNAKRHNARGQHANRHNAKRHNANRHNANKPNANRYNAQAPSSQNDTRALGSIVADDQVLPMTADYFVSWLFALCLFALCLLALCLTVSRGLHFVIDIPP